MEIKCGGKCVWWIFGKLRFGVGVVWCVSDYVETNFHSCEHKRREEKRDEKWVREQMLILWGN